MLLALLAGLAAAPAFDYRVAAGPGARELQVEAVLAAAGPLTFEDGLGPFVRDLSVQEGGPWEPATLKGDRVPPAWCRRSCRVRYRLLLGEAATALRDRYRALSQGPAILAPPSTWLVRPSRAPVGARFRLKVTTPPAVAFVTGLFPGPEAGTYEAGMDDLPSSPYSAFGPFRVESVPVPGGTVEVATLADVPMGADAVRAWAGRTAAAAATYYGRFPVPRALVVALRGGRRPVGYGTTMGNGGASILIWLGPMASERDLRSDWTLTHEMVHLGFPNVARPHYWIEEGLATYAEPFARVRAGQLGEAEAWAGLVDGVPQGLPGAGDEGLDNTHTWGRTYWGGALFWLLADVEIRERTGNRRGLEHALRGIQAAGGSIAVRWDLPSVLAAGDRATGVPVLSELHARMGPRPLDVDLDALWRRLGVVRRGGSVAFDDAAPLAAVRRAMTAPTPPP